jgi:hypothetical protein
MYTQTLSTLHSWAYLFFANIGIISVHLGLETSVFKTHERYLTVDLITASHRNK